MTETAAIDRLYARPAFRIAVGAAAPLAVALGIVLLRSEALWVRRLLPPCVIYSLTGVYCTGCGTTRMLQDVLQGRIAEGFGHNPLMFLLLPLVGYAAFAEYLHIVAGREILPPVRDTTPLLVAVLVSTLLFTFLRNVPLPPFDYLAP